MAEATPEEPAILERQRQAVLAGDREAWLETFDPAFVVELLPDWPGPSRAEGPEAAWNSYVDFFAQFEKATFDYLDIEKHGDVTIFDIRCSSSGWAAARPLNCCGHSWPSSIPRLRGTRPPAGFTRATRRSRGAGAGEGAFLRSGASELQLDRLRLNGRLA